MNMLRILVADDDVLISTFLAEMLEGLGHEVCSIETTEAGTVFSAARCRPDLLIIDVMLGAGSGVSALEQILSVGSVAYVLISGAGLERCPSGAMVLQKPS
jgi:two-component system, response regulator PdtaR